MEGQANELAQYLASRLNTLPEETRFLVGVAGIPASGKSTFSKRVVELVNQLHDREIATLVGQDGWHLTRAQLSAMKNPANAHARRGIHWTFDPTSYEAFIRKLHSSSEVVTAPSFDHAVKDPVVDAISVLPSHRIVIIEGLYVFLDVDGWREAAKLLDERWFLHVDVDRARNRLARRHVESGICQTTEEAIKRADENDIINGLFVMDNMLEPTKRINSVEDPTFS